MRYAGFVLSLSKNTMKQKILFILIAAIMPYVSYAQQPTIIPIETENMAIALQTDNENNLKIIHSGRALSAKAEYAEVIKTFNYGGTGDSYNNSAFSTAGIINFIEPAIAVVHVDGNNSLDLKYQSHEVTNTVDGATLTKVTLKDPHYPFFVELCFKAWKNEDVIEQWSVIRHAEKGEVTLNKYASANLYLYDTEYRLTSYNGDWAKEMQPVTTHLQQGMHTIETRMGTRENLHTSPNFILAMGGAVSEKSGTALMGQIAWNGNFSIQFETDVFKHLHIVAGINPFQAAYKLKANTPFETPRFIYTMSFEGTGKGSRNLQSWMRNHQLLDGKGDRLTLLNNWEATYFDFDQEKLVKLFDGAKELGVNLFLLDDGWFANKYPRNSDNAGLGDWEPNKKKLPDGIPYLVSNAEKKAVKFGIWIEPEMVNPKSELYEKHRDWVTRQDNRPEIYYRQQLVLDLSNPEVQDYVFGIVDKLFTENPSLAYIKWDCNAPIFNAHSKYLERKKIAQSNFFVEYTKGLESVLQRIRAKYPTVPIMLCSGGGGRSDYSLFKYFTEFWLSDNTDPLERVFMQWNYSYYYPAIAMCSHVTDWSRTKTLKYKIDVASMGKLGFDIQVAHLSEADKKFAIKAVKNYDNYKHIVWHGDMYRLASPYEGDKASLMYVSVDKRRAVMFNYLTNWRYNADNRSPVCLDGLNPKAQYRVSEINRYNQNDDEAGKIYSGDFLMKIGLNAKVNTGNTSSVMLIEAI